MSIIGPRPALWNQDVLTAERDKYGANDVKPGLTGWAQINGRDELEIPAKAKLDGEYVQKIGIGIDIKCFLDSIGVFANDNSVVEGGTGELKKHEMNESCKKCAEEKKKILVICQYYKPEPFRISDICEEMVRRGHEVQVVTGYLNYPEGKIYDGYGKGKHIDEIINGVKVHRCFEIPRGTGSVKRMLNYYSYAVTSTAYALSSKCRTSDAMLVTLAADPVLSLTLPGKVQSYMAVGKPLIGAIDGETEIVINEAQCGFCGKAGDAIELTENIRKFIARDTDRKLMGKNARKFYEKNFKESMYMDKLESMVEI